MYVNSGQKTWSIFDQKMWDFLFKSSFTCAEEIEVNYEEWNLLKRPTQSFQTCFAQLSILFNLNSLILKLTNNQHGLATQSYKYEQVRKNTTYFVQE